jgi:hypothetical protein
LISQSKKSINPDLGIPKSVITAQKVAKIRTEKDNYKSGGRKAAETKRKHSIFQSAAEKRLKTIQFDSHFSEKVKKGMRAIDPNTGKSKAEIGAARANITKIKTGQIVDPSNLPEFVRYKRLVWKLTNRQPLHLLENIEKRGHISKNGWQLDHIVSISFGFRYCIPAETIADFKNLRMLPGKCNIRKGTKCG